MYFCTSTQVNGSAAFQLVLAHYAQEVWLRLGDFEEMDGDNDGSIAREELSKAVQKHLGKPPSEQFLNSMIDALDKNGNGCIEREEFEHFRRKNVAKYFPKAM